MASLNDEVTRELASIRGVLAGLRAKIRTTWTIRGLALLGAALCAAAVVSFFLDYFLDMPLAVRVVHLCLLVVALYLFGHWALRPLSTPMIERDLAQAVEHGAPDLRDRLVSALDFEQRLADPAEPESRELMRDVVREASLHAGHLDPGLLVDTRPARRSLAILGAAALVLAVVGVSMADDFSLWLRRGLLLSDIPWPRRTHLVVEEFPETGPKVVTRGDDLRIVAKALGETPPEVVLHYEELSETDPADKDASPQVTFTDARRMYPLEGGEGRFAFDFHAVSQSFRFWLTGGDDQDERPLYSVMALVPPRVASIAGKIRYPDYAKLPDAMVKDASFDVLKESHVTLAIGLNMPVTQARIVPTDANQATAVPLAADGRSLELAFDVTKSLDFHLELTAAQGQTNRLDDDTFHLRATDDRAPELRVLYPPSRLYRTPNGVVPVKVVAKDDFQVAGVKLALEHGKTPAGTAVIFPKEGAAPKSDTDLRRVDAYRPLDLALEFGGDRGRELKPGDLLHLLVTATDGRGNETSSGDLAVEILSVEDYSRRLDQRQGTLREELVLVRRNQQRIRTAIAEIRAAAAKPYERGRDAQVDEGRVTNDLVQFLSGIRQVFDSYVLGRVYPGATTDRILPFYDEALAARSDEEVFPGALYDRIVAEKRASRLYDDRVLGALLDIMDFGQRAVGELSPAVAKSLAAWSAEGPHDPAELERAEKLSTELAAVLAEMEQRMQRWGDLNLLIEMAREVRNTEENLSKDPAGTKRLAPK